MLASAVVVMDILADSLFQISTLSLSEDEMAIHCIRNYLLSQIENVVFHHWSVFWTIVYMYVYFTSVGTSHIIYGVSKNRHFCTMWTAATKYQNNFSLFPFSCATHFSLLCCCKVSVAQLLYDIFSALEACGHTLHVRMYCKDKF